MGDLRVQSITAVISTVAPVTATAQELWKAAVGQEAPNNTSNPTMQMATGSIPNLMDLDVIVQPGRIDMIATPLGSNPVFQPDGVSALDLTSTLKMVTKWAKVIGRDVPANRLAFIVQRTLEAKDGRAAAAIVHSWLPHVPMPEGAVDLFYQTVVERQSDISDVPLTMLARWHTGSQQAVAVAPRLLAGPTKALCIEYYDVFYNSDKQFRRVIIGKAIDSLAAAATRLLNEGYDALA